MLGIRMLPNKARISACREKIIVLLIYRCYNNVKNSVGAISALRLKDAAKTIKIIDTKMMA